MDNIALKNLFKKCRCCLHSIENQEKLDIGELVREKFFEMTQFELSHSTKLAQVVCYNCFSILSRYSALKKGFIENQNVLNNLLKKCENEKVNDFYVTIEAIHEHNCNNEKQDVIALKNLEDLYHVEEFDDKSVKTDKIIVEAVDRCQICDKIFSSRRALKEHTERIHLNVKKHKCPRCEYNCFSSYELNRHKFTNHKSEFPPTRKYLCDLCAVEFTQNSCLMRHKKAHHYKITRFECDKCGHKTFKKENLTKHMRTHMPNSQRQLFKCSKCPAQLSSSYILKMHEKNVHKQHQKNFNCPYANCDKSFSREISLKEHQKFVHLKYRPIACDKCKMSFSSNSHLNRHQKRKHLNSNNLLILNEIN